MTEVEIKIMPDFCNRQYPFHYDTALNLLIKLGVNINSIDILAIGEYKNYRGEIHHQQPAPGTTIGKNTKIVLEVGYSSAVDYMPYQFFYGIQGITSRSDDWENRTRHLMAPFDSSVIRFNAFARHHDLKYSLGMSDLEHLRQYLRLFDFTFWEETPDFSEALLWASIMPSFHSWAGNPDFVAKILHSLFGYRFLFVENTKSEFDIPENIRSHLGSRSSRLGEDLILGRSFSEYDSGYELQISEIKPEDVNDFLPDKPKLKKLQWVLETCMPNNLHCSVKIEVNQKKFMLGKRYCGGCLGYTTYV